MACALGVMLLAAGCEAPAPPAAPAPKAAPVRPLAFKSTPSPTLQAVKARGWLACGVHQGLSGFAFRDNQGLWRGFDVDICRAVAAAVLGDAKAVRFTPLNAEARFAALEDGSIDILSRNTSWTYSRDAGLGFDIAAITYYDGQGFLVPRALALASADELNGARICVQAGTVSETNLADHFRARGLKYTPVVVKTEVEARKLYQAEGCDAFTADVGALASARSVMNQPNAHVILPDVISKEPLGPVVRQNDSAWTDVVRWTVNAMILAEELEITSRNVDDAREGDNPEARRLLGVDADYGAMLGLRPDWAYQVIRQVGSYDEVFRRNLGPESSLRLERGLNAQWNARQPGLLYAPPLR